MENYPDVIHSHNVKDSLFVNINGTIVNKLETIDQNKGPQTYMTVALKEGLQTQQSSGVTLVVTEETYWPMPTTTGLVR